MKVTVEDIVDADVKAQCPETGRWLPCRSLNYRFESLGSRLRNAWGVFTGRYDAFDWDTRKH